METGRYAGADADAGACTKKHCASSRFRGPDAGGLEEEGACESGEVMGASLCVRAGERARRSRTCK